MIGLSFGSEGSEGCLAFFYVDFESLSIRDRKIRGALAFCNKTGCEFQGYT